jgi:hypothetical protein
LITKKSEPQIFGASGQKVKHKAAIYVEKWMICAEVWWSWKTTRKDKNF